MAQPQLVTRKDPNLHTKLFAKYPWDYFGGETAKLPGTEIECVQTLAQTVDGCEIHFGAPKKAIPE